MVFNEASIVSSIGSPRVEGVRRTCSSINPPRPIGRSDRIRAAASNNRGSQRSRNVGPFVDLLPLYVPACASSMDRSIFYVSYPRHRAIDISRCSLVFLPPTCLLLRRLSNALPKVKKILSELTHGECTSSVAGYK